MSIDIVEIWFGIANGKFRQFMTQLSARDTSEFSLPDYHLSKYQWIFTKLGVCIDIVEILFGIVNGLLSCFFLHNYLPATHPCFRFGTITWVKANGFSPNFVWALILWRFDSGLLIVKLRQFLTELSSSDPSVSIRKITCVNLNRFSQTWYVHWYCGDLVWDNYWVHFVNFWPSYLPITGWWRGIIVSRF